MDIKAQLVKSLPSSYTPRVGIGVPVYNGEDYLEATLDSLLAQSFSDFEVFIADNASTDRTEQICRDYANGDSRVHYIRNPINLGASKNYTTCYHPSENEYFRWQNADDPIAPNHLELCVRSLDENPQAVLTYGKTKIIDQHSELIELYDDNLDLRQASPYQRFVTCRESIGLSNILYGLMRREQLAKTALMGDYIASDINLIGELALYGQFHELPYYLFFRRMHPAASSWDRSDSERQNEFWDPSKSKLLMQTWRSCYEYFRAVGRAPISAREKVPLFYYLFKEINWRKKALGQDLTHLIKHGLSRLN